MLSKASLHFVVYFLGALNESTSRDDVTLRAAFVALKKKSRRSSFEI